MSPLAIADAPVTTHQRAWDQLSITAQDQIAELLDQLDPINGAQTSAERVGIARLIAALANITITDGNEPVRCDEDFGCGDILDGFHASGTQVSSDTLLTFCLHCLPDAAARYGD